MEVKGTVYAKFYSEREHGVLDGVRKVLCDHSTEMGLEE